MRRFLFVIVAAVALAACQTTSFQQVANLKRPDGQPRIALMPVDVELYELSAGGIPEPMAEWTAAARENLSAALRAEKAARGIRYLEFDESKASPAAADELHQVAKLHGAVGRAILQHQYIEQQKLPSKHGRFDWTLGPSVRLLKEATGADYALFAHVNDSYTSTGRAVVIVAAALLGVGVRGGQQIGFASLVDLETGDIVWFNRLARGTGDLRTAAPAREVAKTLLTGLPQ